MSTHADEPELLSDSPPGVWVPDVLEGFERMTIPLEVDEEGPNAATLVRPHPRPGRRRKIPVLYVHGWSDYFYNDPLAFHFEAHGYAFYALDLRRYGRSLRPGQTPGWIDSLEAYDDEIGAALYQIGREVPGLPVMMGHSTGGLTAALWSHRHPGCLRALVLNSPWLEMQGSAVVRLMAGAVLDPVTRRHSKSFLKLPETDHYWRSTSSEAQGDWALHPLWAPRYAFKVPVGWLLAVMAGHRQVAAGLDVKEPIYVMLADETVFGTQWSDTMLSADTVLDVEVLADRATNLGRHVTVVRHPHAMHDVMASARPVRRTAARDLFRWLAAYAGPGAVPGVTVDPLIPHEDA